MGRLARIYQVFWRSSLVRELEFKANFYAKMLENVVWAVFFAIVVSILYSHTNSIAGWTKGEGFILSSCAFLLIASFSAVFSSVKEIPEHVRRGTLDFIAVRPVDSQFWVSLRRFNFNELGAILAGIGMLVYGLNTDGIQPALGDWAAFLLSLVCAGVIYYSIDFAMMTLGIYFVRVDNLWVLGDTMMTIARNPVDIYGIVAQRFFLYVLPIALLGTVPARQLARGANLHDILLSLGWAIGLFVASRLFWRHALRSYSSASS